MSANVLVIPALTAATASEDLAGAYTALRNADVGYGGIQLPNFKEAELATRRDGGLSQLQDYLDTKYPLIEHYDGLLVVNDAAETVRRGNFTVPYSVGRAAILFMDQATIIYGSGSGRIFLSHRVPGAEDLPPEGSNLVPAIRSVKKRIAHVQALNPAPLHGRLYQLAGLRRRRPL